MLESFEISETNSFPQLVVVVGGRRMGRGVVMWMLLHGCSVTLIEKDLSAIELARKEIAVFFQGRIARNLLSEIDAQILQDRLRIQENYEGIEAADLVIECVTEDMGVKRNVYADLAKAVGAQTIIASNASSLEISRLAELLVNPGRFLGTHFFYPVVANPVVELIRGNKTDPGLLRKVKTFFAEKGKMPLSTKDSPGFVVNRFFCPYMNTAYGLMEEMQLNAATVDEVALGIFGSRQGPIEISNWLGTHNVYRDQVNLSKLGGLYTPCEALRLQAEKREPCSLGDTETISEAQQQTIRDRLLGIVFVTILQILDEGVATAEDIDLCARFGLRFAHGPCALMDSMGKSAVQALVQPIIALYGDGMPAALEDVGQLCQAADD